MMLDIIHKFTCMRCPMVHTDVYRYLDGEELPFPEMPAGWRVLGKLVLCPQHTITVRIDEEEKEVWP